MEGVYANTKRLAITSRVLSLCFRELHQEKAPKRWQRHFTTPHYHRSNSGIFALFPWTEELNVGAYAMLDQELTPALDITGLVLHQMDRECKHRKGAFGSTFTILILRPKDDAYERIGIITLDIEEAPIYTSGRGDVLENMPSLLDTPYWKDALWYRNSAVRTVYLI